MEREGQSILIAVFTLVFLCVILITLFVIFQRRKNSLLLQQKETEKRFEQEIAKTQIEIREETFRNISWELHDNIGQLLTLAKIQVQNSEDKEEVKKTLDKSLKELRAISKAINPDSLKNTKLASAITQEIDRFNRLNFIKASLTVEGKIKPLDSKVEIIFFRILQEFFSNTIKHAKASNLDVCLNYTTHELIVTAKDDGKGFDASRFQNTGIGLTNIENRAKLVNAKAIVTSKPKEGTQLTIKYTYP